MSADILIVDDEDDIRMLIAGVLEDEGYRTREAAHSDQTLAEIKKKKPDLIIQDIWLEGSPLDGLEILEHMQKFDPDLPMIMISGHGTIEMAVKALHGGAYDFIEKPFKTDKLLVLVRRALETLRLKKENIELKRKTTAAMDVKFNGNSPRIRQVQQVIERVAPTESRVLITGAPGAGKEVAARLIHKSSKRVEGQFVVLNCALMTPERMDEELFGVEKDGTIVKRGLLEQADGGTLFLDEVADMPRETQAKILNVLTNQNFTRIGGLSEIEVNARVIAASHQDLKERISSGDFREDLYYRLNVVPLEMPELSERREDIPELVNHFAKRICNENGLRQMGFSDEAIAFFQAYKWQGNIRQLRNMIEWSLIVNATSKENTVTLDMLPPEIKGRSNESQFDTASVESYSKLMTKPLRDARALFEREYLKSQINRFDGNISRTAKFVGMERSALHRKMKSLGLTDNVQENEDNISSHMLE